MSLSAAQVEVRAKRRGLRRWLGVALATGVWPLAVAKAAPPAPPPDDSPIIIAAPDVHRCLDVSALQQEVEQWLGHAPAGELTIVLRGDRGFGFDVLRGTEELGRRRFADEGQSCAQVVQIIGLAIAMAIEDQMSAKVVSMLPPSEATTDESSKPPTKPESPLESPAAVEPEPRAKPGLGVGPVVAGSSLSAWGFELGAVMTWRGPVTVRAEFDLGYRPQVRLRDVDRSSSSRAMILDGAAALELCLGSTFGARQRSLDACLGLRGGPMFARGLDLAPNSWALAGWLAATSGLLLGLPVGRVRCELAANLLISLVDPMLRTQTPEGETAQTWTSASIGGRVAFAVLFGRQVPARLDSKGQR